MRARHRELLAQLEHLFFAKGYRAVTMNMIAQQLRCSKRALYEIAPNRKALFLMVVAQWVARVQALGNEAAGQHSNHKEKLSAYLEPGVSETFGMSEVFLEDLRHHPQARDLLAHHQKARMARLRDIVQEGIDCGEFASVHPELVAGFCLAAIERINDPTFLASANLSFSEAFSELYRVLLHGLTGDGARSSAHSSPQPLA